MGRKSRRKLSDVEIHHAIDLYWHERLRRAFDLILRGMPASTDDGANTGTVEQSLAPEHPRKAGEDG